MRLADIFELGKGYLMMGVVLVLLAALCLGVGYGVIYRRVRKGTARLRKKKIFLGAVSICYLAVLLGATVLRMGSGMRAFCFYPFYSYREAWHTFSGVDWRNLILNILLFVPFGFLLPFWGRRFEKFIWTAGIGLAATIAIECLQLVTGRGVFEFDDIFNNTLGTLIGYGFFVFGKGVRTRFKKKSDWCGLLPAALTLAVFLGGYLIYENQPYGNLSCEPNYTVNMKNVSLTASCTFADNGGTDTVYLATVADEQALRARADEIFETLHTRVEEAETIEYDDVTIYQSENARYSLWLYKKGLTYSLTDFSVFDDAFDEVEKENAGEQELRDALAELGIEVPREAGLKEEGNGSYSFAVSMFEQDGVVWDGQIRFNYYTNGFISRVDNQVIPFETCGEEELISQQEAYEKIASGRFSYPYFADKIETLVINEVDLAYGLDTKGFYRPLYQFFCEINGQEGEIWIPAGKK